MFKKIICFVYLSLCASSCLLGSHVSSNSVWEDVQQRGLLGLPREILMIIACGLFEGKVETIVGMRNFLRNVAVLRLTCKEFDKYLSNISMGDFVKQDLMLRVKFNQKELKVLDSMCRQLLRFPIDLSQVNLPQVVFVSDFITKKLTSSEFLFNVASEREFCCILSLLARQSKGNPPSEYGKLDSSTISVIKDLFLLHGLCGWENPGMTIEKLCNAAANIKSEEKMLHKYGISLSLVQVAAFTGCSQKAADWLMNESESESERTETFLYRNGYLGCVRKVNLPLAQAFIKKFRNLEWCMFLIGGGVSSVNLLLELARTDTPYQLNMDLLLGFFGVEKVHDENPYYVSLAMSKLYTKKLSPHQRYEFLKYLFDPTAGESVSRFCAKTRMVRNDDRGSVFRSSPLCPCAGAPSNEKAGDLLTSDSSFAELLQVYSSRVNFCNNDSWKKLMSKVVGFSEQSKIDDILTFSSENQELFRQINKDKNDKIVESSKQFLVRTNAAIAFGIREPEALRLKTKRFHQAMDNLLIPSPSLSLSNEFLR